MTVDNGWGTKYGSNGLSKIVLRPLFLIMSLFDFDWSTLRQSLGFFSRALRHLFRAHYALILKNAILRSQLAIYQQQVLTGKRLKPLPTPVFGMVWSGLAKCWPDWHSALLVIKPESVICWHRQVFC